MRLRSIGLIGTLVLGLLSGPLLTEAQKAGKVPRIGYLSFRAGPIAADEAFRQGLHDLGWIEGQNIAVEYRWAAGKRDRYPTLAEELVRLKVDLIVAATSASIRAAKNATTTIPIVMVSGSNAVERGLVDSLARPDGNVTGVFFQQIALTKKRLQLMKETFPDVKAATVFWDRISAHVKTEVF